MKINHIQVNRVHVPLKTAPVDPIYRRKDGYVPTEGLHKHIIQLHTDNGYTGIGETWKGTPDSAVISAAKHLLGQDPSVIPFNRLSLPHNPKAVNSRDLGEMVPVKPISHNPSIHAYEIALADIKGQSSGLKIAQLLGGAVRDSILVHYWAPRLPPEKVGELAVEGQSLGFNGIKLKVTVEDPVIETVKEIGEKCGPDFRITLDPNQRFHTIDKTLALSTALASYPIEVIEDPIPKADFNDYAKLRRSLAFPLALHLERPDDVIRAIRCGAADVFNLRGTMWDVSRLGYLAEVASLKIWRGSGLDLGILDASYTHVCAATPSCTLGSDIVGQFMREDDLITEALVYEDGYVKLPKGPGLGVTLDKEALAHYTVKHPKDKKPYSWNFD
tara:strand:- start:454 stop:1614 length:1161 start_codon:yes stop_codon:yes gene_type:complete